MPLDELKSTAKAAAASLNKVSAMAAKFGKTGLATNFQKTRVVRQPSGTGVGTASGKAPKNIRDIKGDWL